MHTSLWIEGVGVQVCMHKRAHDPASTLTCQCGDEVGREEDEPEGQGYLRLRGSESVHCVHSCPQQLNLFSSTAAC